MKSREKSLFIIVIGWIGTVGLFIAYLLNIFGFIESTGITYALINLIAATLLGIRIYVDRNWSNLVLEIFFGIVAIGSLIRYFFF